MKNKNQLLYTIVGFFVIFGLVISMNSKTAFAEDGKVFYLDDLKVGDFIPNGSTLIVGKSYFDSSGGIQDKVIINIKLSEKNLSFELAEEEVYVMKNYSDYISSGVSKIYDGWIVSDFYSDKTYELEIEPANIDEIDNAVFNENDNEVQLTCKDNSEPTYKWYKVTEINDVQIDTPNKSLWNNKDGLYSYDLVNNDLETDLSSEMTLNFSAKKDDILSFDCKIGDRSLDYSLNGVEDSFDIDNPSAYNNFKIYLTNLGDNQFVFTNLMTENDFFYLKNIHVLSLLNEGSKLDTSKVSKGDKIYYECNCDSGYKYSNTFRYGINDSISGDEGTKENIGKNNSVDKNPQTYSTVIYALSIIFVIGFSIFINREKIFRKDS